MLSGTDLSSAYAYDFEPTPKPAAPIAQPVQKQHERPETAGNKSANMDPNFLTADQKLHLLSAELSKQKEMFETQKGNNYVDKLLSKKRDIIKLLSISFVILFAISVHYMVDHYLRKYFEDNMLTSGKEFLIRCMYPALVLFALWNIKAFNK
jgi:hypothetical protein